MNDELEELLRRSAPEVRERSPRVTAALDELVAAQPVTARRRWRPLFTGGFVVFALAGGASLAAATPGVLAWFGVTDNSMSYSRDDEVCHEAFRAVPADGDSRGGTTTEHTSPELRAAQEYLSALDIDALDLSAQLAELERTGSSVRNPESAARGTAIYEGMIEHVASLGLPTDNIGLNSGGNCLDGTR